MRAEKETEDGRTDMMKLIIAVRNFAYAPKKLAIFQPYIRNTYTDA